MAMRNSIQHPMLQFSYHLLDIRWLSTKVLLDSDSLGDNVLAVASEELNQAEVIRRILEKFSSLPQNEQRDWMEKLMILSGLRGAENIVREEAQKMGISTNIRDNKFYQEAYAAGVLETELTTLRELLEHRFGTLSETLENRLKSLSQMELKAAILRTLDAKQIEDVFGERQN